MVPRRKSRTRPPAQESAECPLSTCLRFLAGAWTPSVLWHLRAGPRRFSELRGDLRSVSAKTLTARLRRLEADGLVHREAMATSPPTVEYALTALAQRLLPALDALVAVGGEVTARRPAGRGARDR